MKIIFLLLLIIVSATSLRDIHSLLGRKVTGLSQTQNKGIMNTFKVLKTDPTTTVYEETQTSETENETSTSDGGNQGYPIHHYSSSGRNKYGKLDSGKIQKKCFILAQKLDGKLSRWHSYLINSRRRMSPGAKPALRQLNVLTMEDTSYKNKAQIINEPISFEVRLAERIQRLQTEIRSFKEEFGQELAIGKYLH